MVRVSSIRRYPAPSEPRENWSIMTELWIYTRRPSSMARYRHGGAAAFDPAVRSPLVRAVAQVVNPGGRDEEKILYFPAPTPMGRPKRSDKPRGGRPKPVGPKKRD